MHKGNGKGGKDGYYYHDYYGGTLLEFLDAAAYGDLVTVQDYCELYNVWWAPLDGSDAQRRGVLHYAASAGHREIVEFLFGEFKKNGLPLKREDSAGYSVLHEAVISNNLSLFQFVCKEFDEIGIPLNEEIQYGLTEGGTVLHVAAHYGAHRVAKFLCNEFKARGFPINQKAYRDDTLLHMVTKCIPIHEHCLETAKLLCGEFLAEGLSLCEKNWDEQTVLHMALEQEWRNMSVVDYFFKALVAEGYDLGDMNRYGRSVLFLAAHRSCREEYDEDYEVQNDFSLVNISFACIKQGYASGWGAPSTWKYWY